MSEHKILAVTGATGYIGRRLCTLALQQGWTVVALSRREFNLAGVKSVNYELGQEVSGDVLRGAHAVIHLAADTRNADVNVDRELAAAHSLMSAAGAVSARFIFVSSQTARPNAPTGYGRSKWAIEQFVLENQGIVIRPGLVYGGPEQGLFGRLCATSRKLPILPAFVPSPRVQPIHVDDLALALLAAAKVEPDSQRVLCVAAPTPTTFTYFLRALTQHRTRRTRLFVPVPTLLVIWALAVTKQALHRFGFDPRQILSLFDLPEMATKEDLATLQVSLRPLNVGMQKSGNIKRRLLGIEGITLLRHVLGRRPSRMLIARYIRALEAISPRTNGIEPKFWSRFPLIVPLLGGLGSTVKDRDFNQRLDVAFRVAEASIFTKPFIKDAPLSKTATLTRIAIALTFEVALILPRILVSQIVKIKSKA